MRIERESRNNGRGKNRIVHAYERGVAGWTSGFGSAADGALLVEEVLLTV